MSLQSLLHLLLLLRLPVPLLGTRCRSGSSHPAEVAWQLPHTCLAAAVQLLVLGGTRWWPRSAETAGTSGRLQRRI